MTSFEEALKKTLLGLDEAFRTADSDLHQEVVSASEALGRVVGIPLRLELRRVSESSRGTTYSLVLTDGRRKSDIVAFLVPLRGYPIGVMPDTAYPGLSDKLKDRQTLSQFFADMAANPDSPLVVKTAYFMRYQDGEEQPDSP